MTTCSKTKAKRAADLAASGAARALTNAPAGHHSPDGGTAHTAADIVPMGTLAIDVGIPTYNATWPLTGDQH